MMKPGHLRSLAPFSALALCALFAIACGDGDGDPIGDETSSSSSGGGNGDSWGNGSTSGNPSSSSSSGSSSGGNTCLDPDDAGDTIDTATRLPDTDDRADPTTLNGIMSGRNDVDMYKVFVKDTYFATLKPVGSTAATNVQLCMYAQCNDSAQNLTLSCKDGSSPDSLASNIKGCCSPTRVRLDYSCSRAGAGADDIQAYIVVRSTADQCSPYTIEYGF